MIATIRMPTTSAAITAMAKAGQERVAKGTIRTTVVTPFPRNLNLC